MTWQSKIGLLLAISSLSVGCASKTECLDSQESLHIDRSRRLLQTTTLMLQDTQLRGYHYLYSSGAPTETSLNAAFQEGIRTIILLTNPQTPVRQEWDTDMHVISLSIETDELLSEEQVSAFRTAVEATTTKIPVWVIHDRSEVASAFIVAYIGQKAYLNQKIVMQLSADLGIDDTDLLNRVQQVTNVKTEPKVFKQKTEAESPST